MRRIALIALAFAGTALYVASFFVIARYFLSVAFIVGIAAGISWPVFGLVLLRVGQNYATAWQWADDCLEAIRIGIFIKMAAVFVSSGIISLASIAPTLVIAFQIVALVLADIAMGCRFISLAAARGMPHRMAIALWVVVLNGIFALLLSVMALKGGLL